MGFDLSTAAPIEKTPQGAGAFDLSSAAPATHGVPTGYNAAILPPKSKPYPAPGVGGIMDPAIVEPVLAMGSSMAAYPISRIAGLAATGKEMISPTPGAAYDAPTQFQNSVQDALTYQPRTPEGQAVTDYNPIALFGKLMGMIGGKAEEGVKSIPVPPGLEIPRDAAASGVREAVEQVPGIVGAKAGAARAASLPARQAALDIQKGLNGPTDAIRNQSQAAGLVTPPEGTSWLAGIPGMAKVDRWISAGNEPKFKALISKQFGLEPGVPLTIDELKSVRAAQSPAYQRLIEAGYGPEITETPPPITKRSPIVDERGQPIETTVQPPPVTRTPGLQATSEFQQTIAKQIEDIGAKIGEGPETFKGLQPSLNLLKEYQRMEFDPKIAIERIKQLRRDATTEFRSDDPSKIASAFTRREIANQLEGLFESNLERTGQTALLDEFRKARKTIAQTYDVEAAMDNVGNLDARKLFHIAQKRPLAENLKLVSDYAGAFPQGAKRLPAGKQGFSPFDWMFTVGSAMHGGLKGLAAAGTELAGRVGVPALAERGALQKRTPSYKAGSAGELSLPAVGAAASSEANRIEAPPIF